MIELHPIICGRKTYEYLPPKLLETRKVYIFTQNINYKTHDIKNHIPLQDIEMLDRIHLNSNLFIIGGAQIYNLFFDKISIFVDSVYQKELQENSEYVKIKGSLISKLDIYKKDQFPPLDNVLTKLFVKHPELKTNIEYLKIQSIFKQK